MGGEPFGVLLDLDETLVLTAVVDELRRRRAWSEVYAAIPSTSLPPGTRAFVDALRRVGPAGIVTTSPRTYAERLLRHHGLALPVLVAYHDTVRHKPWPDPLLEGAKLLGIPAPRIAHIGDAAADEQAATAAGMASVRVGWDQPRIGALSSWDDVLARLQSLAGQ